MASPEVVESSGMLVPGFHEETLASRGWEKKLVLKKGGTPKKKDVVYVAPDGEEIRNKRQLEKYLKNNPGGPSLTDFDWSTGETPRRSARLSSKGRSASDCAEAEPARKRSKLDQDEDTVIIVSPRKFSRRKPGSQIVDTLKEQVIEDTEKAEERDGVAPDAVTDDCDVNLADEKVLPLIDDTLQNKIDGKYGEQGVDITVEEVNLVEIAERVPPLEKLTRAENATEQVNSEGQASKIEEPFVVTDTITEESTAVEEAAEVKDVIDIGDGVILKQPIATSTEVPGAEELVQLREGETSLKQDEGVKEEMNQDILDVLTTERLDETDDDRLKPKEHTESHDIHTIIEEPLLSEVIKSPERQTERSFPAAERVGVST